MKYIDTHAHYNDNAFDLNRDEIINSCFNSNIDFIVNVGADKKSSIESIELSNKYDKIYNVIGVHPHDVLNSTAQDIYDIYENYDVRKTRGIGEIGLDYAFVKDNKDLQKKLFIEQIKLANTLKLPIIIHSRDAYKDTYDIVKENIAEYGVLFHCFHPTDELVRLVLDRNYMVAFGGNITYKRSKSFYELVKKIPAENIMIETDSPYLPPEPHRGTTNSSLNLPIILKKLAEIKQIDEEKLSKIVYDNSVKFFKLK